MNNTLLEVCKQDSNVREDNVYRKFIIVALISWCILSFLHTTSVRVHSRWIHGIGRIGRGIDIQDISSAPFCNGRDRDRDRDRADA